MNEPPQQEFIFVNETMADLLLIEDLPNYKDSGIGINLVVNVLNLRAMQVFFFMILVWAWYALMTSQLNFYFHFE